RRRAGSRPEASRRCSARARAVARAEAVPRVAPWRDPRTAPGRELAGRVLRVGEVLTQLVDERPLRLVALVAEGRFEVGDERLPELGVRFRPRDDSVELAACDRELLCGPHPRLRRRRKGRDQLGKSVFIECAHTLTCPPDRVGTAFLPSSASRSLTKQREIRLAIVPAGSSSASPIVR